MSTMSVTSTITATATNLLHAGILSANEIRDMFGFAPTVNVTAPNNSNGTFIPIVGARGLVPAIEFVPVELEFGIPMVKEPEPELFPLNAKRRIRLEDEDV